VQQKHKCGIERNKIRTAISNKGKYRVFTLRLHGRNSPRE